jgi:hypothetical protein
MAAIAACALVAGLSVSLTAAATTVKGEVVDVMCHMKDSTNKGAGHSDCAMSCAKKGGAMGIATADGVYTITGDYTTDKNAKLLEFVSKNVEASGEVSEMDGKKTINVASMKMDQ